MTSGITKKKVAIIGGGVSGIVAAKVFNSQGHDVIGFERSNSFGGVWDSKRSYPGVQTQSSKDLYRFTDMPMPESYPEWPEGDQVVKYLNGYARKHDLIGIFHFNTSVIEMLEKKDNESGWILKLKSKDGKEYSQDFDFVVVCSGMFTDPNRIIHPNQEIFTENGGCVLHSSEYKHIANDMKDRDVVVIGGSKSATDIAVHAARNGAKSVVLLHRRNVWRIPYFIVGINFKHLLYMRAQEMQFNDWTRSGIWNDPREETITVVSQLWYYVKLIATMLCRFFIWANFRALETLLSFQLGLKKWNMMPSERIEDTVSCELPIVTEGLFECFQNGTITPIHSTVDKYIESNDEANKDETTSLITGKKIPMIIRLENGQELTADTVIHATGWKMNHSFLPSALQEQLVDEKDGQFRLYRWAVNPHLPNIGFVGLNSSFCSVLSSELIANWLVRYVDGMLTETPSIESMNSNIQSMLEWKRKERPAAKVYRGNCIAPFHYLHFDEILRDIGAVNKVTGMFTYPDADQYGRCLESAPQYFVE